MQREYLENCKRSKNLVMSPAIKKVIRKAFTNSNAAKLPVGSFYELYAETNNLLSEMRNPTNQIIWGRRGTGKTHLLNTFVEIVNHDDKAPDIALYISCDRMARETPHEPITFANDLDRARFFANETYRNFMTAFCEQLFNEYENLLIYKKDCIHSERSLNNTIELVGSHIIELTALVNRGVPRTSNVSSQTDSSSTTAASSEAGFEISSGFNNTRFTGILKGLFSKNKKSQSDSKKRIVEDIKYERSLPSIQARLSKLLDDMNIDCLYVCIDELWLVDEKNTTSFQPFFLDNLRSTLGIQSKLGIKIASIRETTNLNTKNDARYTYGMQSGSDIIELSYLDPVQSNITQFYAKFKLIILRRLNYYLTHEPDIDPEEAIEFSEDDLGYIIEMFFKEERNFKILVDMSHGIPRNFINLLNSCLRKIDYDLSSYYIHCYLISDVVIEAYTRDHRSDLSFFESNTVFDAIEQYAHENAQYFFLIDNKTVARLSPELSSLLYKEIIHRIPSSETPLGIMNKYKAYYLDLGMYFLSIKDSDYSEYEHVVQNFHLLLPDDLKTNYKKYILNLANISGDYIVCPTCQKVFSKSHPVYNQFKICPDCASGISS